MPTKKIGIDCRFWGLRHAGLGRYTQNLVLEIINQSQPEILSGTLSFTLFFQKGQWGQDKEKLKNCQIVEVDIPHYSVQEQILLPKIIDKQNLDLIHYPHFNFPVLAKTPFVITIHDLIKHFFRGREVTTRNLPTYYLKHLAYRYTISQAVKKAKAIITPSVFTKDQIISNLNISDKKIKTIYEGVSAPYHNPPQNINAKIISKYKLTKPYFVYTGSAYPSKNIPTLLKALKKLIEINKMSSSRRLKADIGDQAPKLIIACARNIFWDRLKNEVDRLALGKNVILPGNIPDQDLLSLYQNATAFIMPSLMEGFGLPALEAMAVGCPIISSETGSLPEIYGQNAFYFNPTDENQLANIMQQAITLTKEERQKIIEKGQKHSQNYTWEKAAYQTFKVYKNILSL